MGASLTRNQYELANRNTKKTERSKRRWSLSSAPALQRGQGLPTFSTANTRSLIERGVTVDTIALKISECGKAAYR
jgi:hypothetical protein